MGIGTLEAKIHLFSEYLKVSDFHIIGLLEHRFEPYGYTSLWLLAESRLAIHCSPDDNKTYLEISSCSRQAFSGLPDNLSIFAEWRKYIYTKYFDNSLPNET